MIHLHQASDPSPLSKTVRHMALNVYDQAQMLLMDISSGTHTGSVESRLGGITGAILQLECVLESYRRMGSDQPIYDPDVDNRFCNHCHLKNR